MNSKKLEDLLYWGMTIISIIAFLVYALVIINKPDKVKSLYDFSDQCVTDKVGWIKDKNILLKGMEKFYSTTGCQPYLVISDKKPKNEDEAKKWTKEYFEENVGNRPDAVLYVCFANDLSYVQYGKDVKDNFILFEDVVSKEFFETAESLLDRYQNKSEMIGYVFSDAGEAIMDRALSTKIGVAGALAGFWTCIGIILDWLGLYQKIASIMTFRRREDDGE